MSEHLRACVDDADHTDEDLVCADVLYFARPVDASEVVAQLAAFPGCVICAGTAYDGTMLLAVRAGIGQTPNTASIVHALLVLGSRRLE
jgi:hypothetical protein